MIFPPTTDGMPLGLGGAPLGNLFTAIPETQATSLLAHVIDDGCRSFDTAPHYGNGRSEHRIGTALRDVPRTRVCLSSKTGR
jgi:D-threo-aldose 1-dehydrogenase